LASWWRSVQFGQSQDLLRAGSWFEFSFWPGFWLWFWLCHWRWRLFRLRFGLGRWDGLGLRLWFYLYRSFHFGKRFGLRLRLGGRRWCRFGLRLGFQSSLRDRLWFGLRDWLRCRLD
jgi:hypothetical protein